MKWLSKNPALDGTLPQCAARHGGDTPALRRRWHREQMRRWAAHWRNRRLEAALLGTTAEEHGKSMLWLACMYRDEARRVAA